jgi:hypothetical protein
VLQADAGSEHERILFGLPVVMDTDDDSISTGDTLLLQYQVRRRQAADMMHLCSWAQRHLSQRQPRQNAVSTIGRRAVASHDIRFHTEVTGRM